MLTASYRQTVDFAAPIMNDNPDRDRSNVVRIRMMPIDPDRGVKSS